MEKFEDFWHWVSYEFIDKVKATEFYNGANYSNIGTYINDTSSILIGYPTIRQIRIKNSNL